MQWRKLECGGGPSPRAGHSLTLVGRRLFAFGGGDSNAAGDPNVFNDLYSRPGPPGPAKRLLASPTADRFFMARPCGRAGRIAG